MGLGCRVPPPHRLTHYVTGIDMTNTTMNTGASSLSETADALEAEYMAVASGQKKPSRIALEPMVRAVKLLRALSTPQADAAIAAGGAQEARERSMPCTCGEFAPGIVHRTDGPCYVAETSPHPREAATVLTDEQRTAIAGGAAALRKNGGFDFLAEELDALLAASNGEQA
jgi:hypothetical protein